MTPQLLNVQRIWWLLKSKIGNRTWQVLESENAQSVMSIKVEDFFRYFFSDDAVNFLESFHKKCGDKDFKCGSWHPQEKFGYARISLRMESKFWRPTYVPVDMTRFLFQVQNLVAAMRLLSCENKITINGGEIAWIKLCGARDYTVDRNGIFGFCQLLAF
ncbi:hypothetical protein V8G54_010531 [Vigna mungo]|uniref:VASt domain-containing protein n=1 Tax=Vigna mungo TaxID=3915 RepID=A0AAQ3NWU4_VIGMU